MALADRVNLEFDTPSSLPNLGVYKVGLHLLQIFFAFLILFLTSSIISTERYYLGGSKPAPNYTLVVTLASLLVAAALAYFPWSTIDRGFVKLRSFFLRPRTTVIFTCFMTLSWFAAMISMTVHSTDSSNCTLNQNILKNDTSYATAWVDQCNCAKAAAAFSWFSFVAWLATAVCSAILLWHEKKLKHAERSAPRNSEKGDEHTVSSSETKCDEDTRTIVGMHYLDKDKQSVTSLTDIDNDELRQYDHPDSPAAVSATTIALPTPSAPPMTNSEDELVPSVMNQSYDTPAPYAPSRLASPFVPPAAAASPYPTPLYGLNSPYTNNNTNMYQGQHGPPPFIPPHGSPYPQQQYGGTPQYTTYPTTPTHPQYGLPETMYQSTSGYHVPSSALNQAPVVHQYQQQAVPYSQQYPQ